MAQTLDYGCQCGAIRGQARDLVPAAVNRLVCMCDDCQAFAAFLAPTQILDAAGGTEVCQTTPSQLTIADGHEHLRCVRLSPKGILRWYAACCKTPLGNTLARAGVPFVGVPVMALHPTGARDAALGPIRARIQARFARPGAGADGHPRAPLSLIARSLRLLLQSWLKRRHTPSPFFRDGAPVREPTVLTAEQRAELALQDEPRRAP